MKKFINGSGARFLIGGAVNTAATYVLYLALLQIVSYRIAYTVTYVTGIVFGYCINATWVFRSKFDIKSALLYPAVYLLQYLLGVGLLSLLVELLGVDKRLAPLLVILVTVPLMFLLNRFFFRRFGSGPRKNP